MSDKNPLDRMKRAGPTPPSYLPAVDDNRINSNVLFCDRFISPIKENNTFFSPMDPRSVSDVYPPLTNCTFVLEGKSLKIAERQNSSDGEFLAIPFHRIALEINEGDKFHV